jgi:hypothetical protein
VRELPQCLLLVGEPEGDARGGLFLDRGHRSSVA